MAAVERSSPDLPGDTPDATFRFGHGLGRCGRGAPTSGQKWPAIDLRAGVDAIPVAPQREISWDARPSEFSIPGGEARAWLPALAWKGTTSRIGPAPRRRRPRGRRAASVRSGGRGHRGGVPGLAQHGADQARATRRPLVDRPRHGDVGACRHLPTRPVRQAGRAVARAAAPRSGQRRERSSQEGATRAERSAAIPHAALDQQCATTATGSHSPASTLWVPGR